MAKSLFSDQPASAWSLLFAALAAALLMFIDVRTAWLHPLRDALAPVGEGMLVVADLPRRSIDGVVESLQTRSALEAENARLARENLVLQRHVQQVAALTAENARLRELLNSSALLDSSVLVAEIIGVDPDPSRREVIIDKGGDDGLYVGQPVLDASGILGQVIAIGPSQSRAILITDARHGVPVEVVRNGVRSIVVGTGTAGLLQLQYLPVTTDVRIGDLLVSSGLGGRFPKGYPVGRVTRVERNPGETFATVIAQPTAAIERSRHVLLVFQRELQGELLQNAGGAAPVAPAAGAAMPPGAPAATGATASPSPASPARTEVPR